MGVTQSYYTFNGQDNLFTFYNKSTVLFLEASYQPSDPEYSRFGSMEMTRGMIEEAGEKGITESAKNNLAASIGRWKNEEYGLKGKLLLTCNPTKNFLYQDYKAFKAGKLPQRKKFIQALPTDNKMLDSGYIEHLHDTLSPNEKERLLYGNWEYESDPSAMCDYTKITDLFSNDFENLITKEKYITADIARLGSDKIVIGLWHGFVCKEIFTIEKKKITETYTFIDQLRRTHGIPLNNVICDEDGVGGGAVDMLGCKGFVNNSKALNGENYSNLQSQCAFKLADKINTNQIYLSVKDSEVKKQIIEELEQLKRKDMDSDGKVGIIPKDQVKAVIGRSPDYRDMLLMRMYFDVNKSFFSAY